MSDSTLVPGVVVCHLALGVNKESARAVSDTFNLVSKPASERDACHMEFFTDECTPVAIFSVPVGRENDFIAFANQLTVVAVAGRSNYGTGDERWAPISNDETPPNG